MMTEEIVKNIIDKVYPKIKSDYGLSRYNDFPNILNWNKLAMTKHRYKPDV